MMNCTRYHGTYRHRGWGGRARPHWSARPRWRPRPSWYCLPRSLVLACTHAGTQETQGLDTQQALEREPCASSRSLARVLSRSLPLVCACMLCEQATGYVHAEHLAPYVPATSLHTRLPNVSPPAFLSVREERHHAAHASAPSCLPSK
jgi:hypothetical protein